MSASETLWNITAVQAFILGVAGTAVFFSMVVFFLRHTFNNKISNTQSALKAVQDREATHQAEIQNLLEQVDALKSEQNQNQTQIAVLNTRLEQSESSNEILQKTGVDLEVERERYLQKCQEFEKIQLAADKDLLAADDKIQLLLNAEENLRKNFENLANRIFEEKTNRFVTQNKESVNHLLTPLREQIGDFKKKVEDVYYKESRERTTLLAEINQLKNLNQQMSEDAVNLTKALKGENKVQGNWGEVILERVLEESGLSRGREYETQVVLKDKAGQRYIPDVILKLPENRQIIIDAKVSLIDYEKYCSSDDKAQREASVKQHVASLKRHINSLSEKDYSSLEGISTLDFVFIFIPIEAAFMLAVEKEPQLFREAFDKNIIIVSPTTLLATLRTVASIWRYEAQNKNAEEIARQAGAIHDQLVLMLESMDSVGTYLGKAQDAHNKALARMSQGRGNLVSKVKRLEELGAKTKKQIPEKHLDVSTEIKPQEETLSIESTD